MRLFKGPVRYGRELPGYPFGFRELFTRCVIVAQRKFYCDLLKTRRMRALRHNAVSAADAQRLIYQTLCERQGRGTLVARFGTGEMETTLRALAVADPDTPPVKLAKMLAGRIGPFWWDNSIRSGIHWIAGVFPPDDDTMSRFGLQTLEDCKQIDLLGGWISGEQFLHDRFFPDSKCYPFGLLVQPDCPETWTRYLKGKKVLAVSPFDGSIRSQYARREKLFANPEFLPEFDLVCYRPVVSHAGAFAESPYRDWFEALEAMKSDISKIDFDIALISAGAYGMSLGAHVKRMGKTAVHMGGVLQMLFGIKGSVFDRNPYFSSFYNDFWVRPAETERPKNYRTVEGGSYW